MNTRIGLAFKNLQKAIDEEMDSLTFWEKSVCEDIQRDLEEYAQIMQEE